MRKLAGFFVLLALFLSTQAQRKQIDSLKKMLTTAKEDTTKTLLYSQLGNLYYESRPDSVVTSSSEKGGVVIKLVRNRVWGYL